MKRHSEKKQGITLGLKDERITKLGKWLRNYYFDEIPQLVNVLKGDMSIVGPRPQVPYYTDKYHDLYKKCLKIKPGLISESGMKFKNEGDILNRQKDPISFFEKEIIPAKCKLDSILANNLNLKNYFSLMLNFGVRYFLNILKNI